MLKNLVLAGVRAAIWDNRSYPDDVVDTPSLLLAGTDRSSSETPRVATTVAQAIKPVVEEMNPLLGECEIITSDPLQFTSEFISRFSVVLVSRFNMELAIKLASFNVTKVYLTDTFGLWGGCVIDLGSDCSYHPEQGKEILAKRLLSPYVPLSELFRVPLERSINRFYKTSPPDVWIRYRSILEFVDRTKQLPSSNIDDFVQVTRTFVDETSPALREHPLFDAEALKEVARLSTSEIAPVCAVLGGLLGNEVIKVISGRGEPANNTILFDGISCKALSFLVQRG